MSRLLQLLLLTFVALAAPSAWAQCEGDWDNDRISRALDDVHQALSQADLVGAKAKLKDVGRGWPCLQELVEKPTLARFGRAQGLLAFYEQDEPTAIRWGLMARIHDPDGDWPGDLPDDHPYLEMLADEEAPPVGRAEGWLVPPEKGSVFINGDFIPEPTAHAEIPGLVQLFDRNGFPVETFWQDGAAFRDGLTSPEGGPIEVPKYYNPATGELKVGKAAKTKQEKLPIERAPIDFPVVPVATAGGLAAVSGISYALAGAASGGLANAETEADLTRARSTTNALVLVSAITGAGAVGVGLGTVLVHSNGVMWTVRF